MEDAKPEKDEKLEQSSETAGTPAEYPGDVPEIDGSVDALVANLRAAKDQLAELLETGSKSATDAGEADETKDRSAA